MKHGLGQMVLMLVSFQTQRDLDPKRFRFFSPSVSASMQSPLPSTNTLNWGLLAAAEHLNHLREF